MSDPAQPLHDFQPEHEFFIGIDSDGCAFDTMGIKQRECFCPWMISYFGLQPVAQQVGKQMVITIPNALVVEGDDEQVGAFKRTNHFF